MTITVTDFERITGVSRHTVYAWFYREKFPKGVKPVPSLGSTRLIKIGKASEYYDQIAEFV